ncbi:competence protein CoiA [Lactobacillus taiwanensis]|uniref:competence protein CoiA n=1 Tax=Lactobacillus taiwanensis TaxID=508451 RepID=UPI00242AE519|nr:competence protein CoiA family protein [Lactobacillus taiwanensis]
MYAAILNQKLVLAVNEAKQVNRGIKKLNQDYYLCPSCRHRMILILSEDKTPFFKHFYQVKGTGEKEEHSQAKILLCTALKANGIQAEVEVSLLDQQLRADVLVENKLSFEVQCAPLSEEEFNHRHQLYKQINIKDIWIVGKRHYLKKKINQSQEIFLRYSPKWQWYYLEIDPFKCLIRLKYNILKAAISSEIQYDVKTFPLDEEGVAELFLFTPVKKIFKVSDIKDQKKYLQKQLVQKSKIGLKIGSLLYQLHYSIDDIPKELFLQLRKPKDASPILTFLQKKLND